MAQKVNPLIAIYITVGFGAAVITALVIALTWHFWNYGKAFSF
ncbi:MAG TPA: hypothetical protein VFA74_03640 [Terriglobales bacterium]|nr:hypothetical protein [Terriglobales bacterium]